MSATMNVDDRRTTATAVVRDVRFPCPRCGEDRDGRHVQHPHDDDWVECRTCSYRCDAGVLAIPTASVLDEWYGHALRHSQAAVRCADGTPACSYLAIVWCRRLAHELSPWGKAAFLDSVVRPLDGPLSRHQREVVLGLGVALRMSTSTINRLLDDV